MSNKLTNLLRKVFFSSLAGITASNTTIASPTINLLYPNNGESKIEYSSIRKPDLIPQLLLKKKINEDWTFISHRSHRSHSSHRSHYSSYSGSSNGNNTQNSNPGIRPNYNDSTNGSNVTTTSLQLGSRTLRLGMSGTDVTELVNILLRKNYLKLDNGGTVVTGSYNYDEIIEGAVKKFQTDNGLTSNGICDSATIYYLKNR